MSPRDNQSVPSTHQRIISDYYATTSAAGRDGPIDYAKRTAGLKRGLRDWLDVKGKTVLDLGCGTGELCWLALAQGASHVTGVNLSQGEIDFAAPQVDASFICQNIEDFLSVAPPVSVDRIFALNILEHLSKDELAHVLEQAFRVLRPGGHLVAMVPNALSPFGTMTRYWDITHRLSFTPSSIVQLQCLAGFAAAEFREWGPRPHGLISTIRYGLWQGIRLTIALRLMIETGSDKGRVYTADMLFRLFRDKS